jgi:uncharacterized protein YjbI with pentapeptide repeats
VRLLNSIALGFAPLPSRVGYPEHSVTLIAKALLKMQHGAPCQIVTPKEPFFPMGDVNYSDDEEGRAGPRYASDYVPFKPGGDALLVGHFHAPGGRSVRLAEAGLTVGNRSLRVAVVGRRTWSLGKRWPGHETALPFTKLDLRWENAFGGPGSDANPVGRGSSEGPPQALDLPQIERLDRPFSAPEQRPDPICFAPLRRDWFLRRALLGTFDRRWQETRWPWFPEDFDWRHFQSAVPELRFRNYIAGDETISCLNLHPTVPEYETSLPGVKVLAAVQRRVEGAPGGAKIEPVGMNLDTLWIDMDAETACLVWRGHCRTRDKEMSDILNAWAGIVPLAAPAVDADAVQLTAAAIRADEAEWEIQAKAPPEKEIALPPKPELPAAEEDEPPSDEIAVMLAKIEAAKPPEQPLPPTTPEQDAQIQKSIAEAEAKLKSELDEEPDDKPPPWTPQRVRDVLGAGGILAGEDLSNLDLGGIDFSGRDLTGTVLAKTSLAGAKLVGTKLGKASLAGADLSGADLAKADLKEADLSGSTANQIHAVGADFSGANLAKIAWKAAVLKEAVLKEVHAPGAALSGADFRGAQLDEADFEQARLDRADFEGAQSPGASFVKASLAHARFVGTNLKEADFSGGDLQDAVFEKADLTDATFEKASAARARFADVLIDGLRAAGVDLTASTFLKARGQAPYLEGGKLGGATITDCALPGADFSQCDLHEARILGCTLKTAKFVLADLRAAQLTACDCFEALFEGALLDNCDGSDSSFFGAEFLDAQTRTFRGRNRNLLNTKLSPPTQ